LLDPGTRYRILGVEAYYKSVKDDLSNTAGIYHTGDTFGVPFDHGDKDVYEKLFQGLVQQTEGAIYYLKTGHYCDELAKTSFFWPRLRQVDSAADR
jgi:hypothetical protein